MFANPEIQIGSPLSHGNVTVFPLHAEFRSPIDYRLANEALTDGSAVVEEVSEGGHVPQLSVENKGERRLLFLEGQELRGAKQNRVLNASLLIAAHVKTVLPVSCVEQGRWRYTSQHFAAGDTPSSMNLRSVLKASVNASVHAGRGHGSDQGSVWREVGRQMESHGASSVTGAMADTYEAKRRDVESLVAGLTYPEGATGLAVAVGDKLIAVDVFDSPETCRKVWSRLLSGAAMDAMESSATGAPDEAAVRTAIDTLRVGPWNAVSPAGIGEEYRGQFSDRWHGSVLALNDTLIHGSLVLAG